MLIHDALDKQLLYYYYSLATRYDWWGPNQSGDDAIIINSYIPNFLKYYQPN